MSSFLAWRFHAAGRRLNNERTPTFRGEKGKEAFSEASSGAVEGVQGRRCSDQHKNTENTLSQKRGNRWLNSTEFAFFCGGGGCIWHAGGCLPE